MEFVPRLSISRDLAELRDDPSMLLPPPIFHYYGRSRKIKVLEIRYDAQSAFIVNSLGKIKNLWMIVFFETLMFNVLIIFC